MKLKTKDYVQVSTLRQIAEKADIILLVGVRSGGKSFAVRQLCIEDAYKNGSKFAYLRRAHPLKADASMVVRFVGKLTVSRLVQL